MASRSFLLRLLQQHITSLETLPGNPFTAKRVGRSLRELADYIEELTPQERNVTEIDRFLTNAHPEIRLTVGTYDGDEWVEIEAEGECVDDVLADVAWEIEQRRKALAGAETEPVEDVSIAGGG